MDPRLFDQPPGESRRTAMTARLAAPKATPLHAYSLFIQTKPCWRPDTFLLWFGTKFGRNNGLAEWAVTEAMSRQHSWWWSGFKSCLFHNSYDYAEVIRAYMIYIMDASEWNTPLQFALMVKNVFSSHYKTNQLVSQVINQ